MHPGGHRACHRIRISAPWSGQSVGPVRQAELYPRNEADAPSTTRVFVPVTEPRWRSRSITRLRSLTLTRKHGVRVAILMDARWLFR
jgi:hypothetical protein